MFLKKSQKYVKTFWKNNIVPDIYASTKVAILHPSKACVFQKIQNCSIIHHCLKSLPLLFVPKEQKAGFRISYRNKWTSKRNLNSEINWISKYFQNKIGNLNFL